MKILILLWLFFMSFTACAEYRVYQYYVTPVDYSNVSNLPQKPSITTTVPTIVTTSLDPVSYLAYHGGNSSINIQLLRSWMCPGFTSEKRYCDSPYKQIIKFKSSTESKEGPK
ncbi:MAG: hypothetical protein HQK52_16670 [Oligoflexia bacterium]|nr:hypothetical protein [Oligoflexia bacterium]